MIILLLCLKTKVEVVKIIRKESIQVLLKEIYWPNKQMKDCSMDLLPKCWVMAEFWSSALIRSKELDTSEVKWERKSGLVLAICSCAVLDSSKTKNAISSLNTPLMKSDNWKPLVKYHRIYKSTRAKARKTVKEASSFSITQEMLDLTIRALSHNHRANLMKTMISKWPAQSPAIRKNLNRSILIISERFYYVVSLIN